MDLSLPPSALYCRGMSEVPPFRELQKIEDLIEPARQFGSVEVLAEIEVRKKSLPIHAFHFGGKDKSLPTIALFAGVHGLEKVGTHIATYFLRSFISKLQWNRQRRDWLEQYRLLVVPLVNPGGMWLHSRSNPSGVDLMRNAPIDCQDKPLWMVSGHRYSDKLPWYRGDADSPMEIESQAIVDFCRREVFPAKVALSLDLHSGFGIVDRLWYPYATSKKEFPLLPQVQHIKNLLKVSYPYHVYRVEPQSDSYIIHGDLWDYLFNQHQKEFSGQHTYIPWCLEMGSWLWVRKNPRQLFSLLGGFNPTIPHRYQRTMRRHMPLLDFFQSLVANTEAWCHP